MGPFVLKRVFSLCNGHFSPGFVSRAKFRENEKLFEVSDVFTAHAHVVLMPNTAPQCVVLLPINKCFELVLFVARSNFAPQIAFCNAIGGS